MVKILVKSKGTLDFPFKKCCDLILSIVPKEDILGISEIRIIEIFSNPNTQKGSIAIYFQEKKGQGCIIEINVIEVMKNQIPKYLFEDYKVDPMSRLILCFFKLHLINSSNNCNEGGLGGD